VRVGWRSVWAADYAWRLGAGRLEECLGYRLWLEVRCGLAGGVSGLQTMVGG